MSHPLNRPCPRCQASIGQHCLTTRGATRKAFHRERGSRRCDTPIAEVEAGLTDSPIEDTLLSVLLEWLDHEGRDDVTISTQVPIGPYRADMVVRVGEGGLVVEADGVAFHSSLERIQHDKRRDRYCVSLGYYVMRFTGAEIIRDPRGCAAEIGAWIRGRM